MFHRLCLPSGYIQFHEQFLFDSIQLDKFSDYFNRTKNIFYSSLFSLYADEIFCHHFLQTAIP